MIGKFGYIVLVWLLLHGFCLGSFVVEKNNLRVTTPESLRGVYECAIGNFGVPQYGGLMIGTVMYPKSNQEACRSFHDVDINLKSEPGRMPIFLLADRGDCYFTLKAWNAQNGGAAAILVADDRAEPLITMDAPEEQDLQPDYLQNITVPSALISKTLGDSIKKVLSGGHVVNIYLDWREALPHPDERVEYEFWTDGNAECGQKCDTQLDFINNFKGIAQIMEQKGYTQFTPHYMTWYCPEAFRSSRPCKSQCINNGRYCSPDPEEDFDKGYDGKDVIIQNLRQACFFKVANDSGRPWLWWDYVTDFSIRCPMSEGKYNLNCAEQVMKSLGMDVDKINNCVGDTDADVEHPVLKAEQEAQVGKGTRGDVTILPTLVVNGRQYRGKLERAAVLKAICSAFEETTEPASCLSTDIQTNECLHNNGGCWEDKSSNLTACKDTFRGKVCHCPVVQGIQFLGDGYVNCKAVGALRCGLNNGGCWKESRNGETYTACLDDDTNSCVCPPGFRGDGFQNCEDIDECKERLACQCPECNCKNTWGSYECSCSDEDLLLYMKEHDTCIVKYAATNSGWGVLSVILLGIAAAGFGAYAVYKYKIRSYMNNEIRAIMAQYMPLDNQGEVPSHHVEGQQNV